MTTLIEPVETLDADHHVPKKPEPLLNGSQFQVGGYGDPAHANRNLDCAPQP